jgi:hypothetical protein
VLNCHDIRQRLKEATTVAQVDELGRQLARCEGAELFEALFPVAVDNRLARAAGQFGAEPWEHLSFRAGKLLVDLDPPCPVSCAEALRMVTDGDWDLSLKEVPFYLISQFGKLQLGQTVRKLLEGASDAQEKLALETIAYWLAPATIDLLSTSRSYWDLGRSSEVE